MRADEWIVDFLVKQGVTDVFGIPGVVVMDFLYAIDKRKPDITPHLNYHEQGAAYAACGYAQATGKMGVAYSTRGPGLTNMLTAIADAYYDSLPVMFITAHSTVRLEPEMRVMNNQEIDTVELAKSITKKAIRIDVIEDLQKEVIDAYQAAVSGRKGPVFLDIYNALFSKEVEPIEMDGIPPKEYQDEMNLFIKCIEQEIHNSKRPVILVGNGVRGKECSKELNRIAMEKDIPVLSSRSGQDVIPYSLRYYGFVGSRATRYSNFILSKADLIISIGNRLAFPQKSKSFLPIVENTHLIRVDIDDSEFVRQVPNSVSFQMDSLSALKAMERADLRYQSSNEWISICEDIRKRLDKWDVNTVIQSVMSIIRNSEQGTNIVCDVGNHSFWISTAYAYLKATNRIMYSGSFGALGSALPKAIGVYYSTRKPVVCFTGDQGVQFNIQELQFISSHNLPIKIVILNNSSSGMIMEREIAKYGKYLVHTTTDSGYSFPEFCKVASCYNLDFVCIKQGDLIDKEEKKMIDGKPGIIEVLIDRDMPLEPSLPIGNACQNLSPELPKALYEEINNL